MIVNGDKQNEPFSLFFDPIYCLNRAGYLLINVILWLIILVTLKQAEKMCYFFFFFFFLPENFHLAVDALVYTVVSTESFTQVNKFFLQTITQDLFSKNTSVEFLIPNRS